MGGEINPSDNNFIMRLIINFDLKQITHEYYSISDVISSLGGIGSSVKLLIGALGVFWIVKFVLDLAMILKR